MGFALLLLAPLLRAESLEDAAHESAIPASSAPEPAAALLPQWLSGYAFLFGVDADPPGDLAKLLAERVALNARQAAILADPPSGVHLFAWHYSSLSPRSELNSLFAAYNLTEPSEVNVTGTDHEQLYARERRVLQDRRVLPLIVQAESVALGANVRDWMPARWGEWHLADVWLELPEPAAADSSNTGNSAVQALPQPRPVAPGAKP